LAGVDVPGHTGEKSRGGKPCGKRSQDIGGKSHGKTLRSEKPAQEMGVPLSDTKDAGPNGKGAKDVKLFNLALQEHAIKKPPRRREGGNLGKRDKRRVGGILQVSDRVNRRVGGGGEAEISKYQETSEGEREFQRRGEREGRDTEKIFSP